MDGTMVGNDLRDDMAAFVKERADIVQIIGECVELKRSGVRFLGRCPFHGEKTPSFSVHGGQQFYHCFGCGASGDVFSFMMKYHNLDFPSALKELAKRYHIELPERRPSREEQERQEKSEHLFAINEKCATLYAHYLQETSGGHIAREYLAKRGVSKELISRFRIGYAPAVEAVGWNYLGNQLGKEETKVAILAGLLVEKEQGGSYDRFRDRILFPIFDISGRICGFGGRIVGEGQPKYLNSPESPVFNKSKLLLGLFQQKEFIRKHNHGILVEGNFDLISLVAHGCNNVAAPLGTALTREQLRLLKRFAERVTLLFDGDEAGRKAAVRAVPLFLAEQIPGRVAFLPAGHDPDTFVRQRGLADLNVLLEQAVALPEFALEHLVGKHGLTLDGKSKILEELRPLIAVAASPLQRSLFIAHFAEKLGLTAGQLDTDLQGPAASSEQSPVKPAHTIRPEPRTSLDMAQRQLLQFMILQPQCFSRLAAAGLRDCLAGSIGEILFLELERIRAANRQTEPEELLSVLPEGAERTFVADVLLRSQWVESEGDEDFDQELTEILRYLRTFQLKKQSEGIMQQIEMAEKNGDQQLLQELLTEKQKITGQLHGDLQ